MGDTTDDLLRRIDVRRQAQRRRRLRFVAIVLGVVAIVGVAIWLLFFSRVFEAHETTVTGNNLVSTEEILAIAEVPLGTPLARMRTDPIEQRILTLAPVADVNVSRSLPDTVAIEVTERQVLFQREVRGTYQWVDDTGRIFHTAQEPTQVVTVTTDDDSDAMMKGLADMVSSLTPPIQESLERIEVRSRDNVVLFLTEDRQVNWGSTEDSETKAMVLESLLAVSGSTYDVSAPGNPAVRPR